jgi:MFS family permease
VATAFVGPVIGPIVGDFITESHLGWRWTMWITMIAAYSFSIIACVVLPETYAPTLLTAKAARLRIQTKNWALHSKMEEEGETTFKSFAQIYLVRPWSKLYNLSPPSDPSCSRSPLVSMQPSLRRSPS